MVAPAFKQRTLSAVLRRAAAQFPAVVVTGPRQSGKTTLVRHHFQKTHGYATLDDPRLRAQATADAELFLARFPPPVILDEIQYAPELLHYLKVEIDRHRARKGRYVLTGSQIFPLMQGASESLAGRAAILTLASLSLAEIFGRPAPNRRWRSLLLPARLPSSGPGPGVQELAAAIYRGGYPEPALQPALDARLWHASYVQTYLERDVRSLRAVGDLADFQRFVFALAARSGGLVSFAELARDLAISAKTVRAWLSVLEAGGQVLTLKPYHQNLGKRLVKAPKVFFLDTGILAYLLGLGNPDQVLTGIAAGPVFETAVLGQLYRLLVHRGELAQLYFWRTANGHEVDFVIEAGSALIPIEAKLTASPTARDAASIERFQQLFGSRASKGLVICLCRERYPLTRSVDAVPLGSF